MKVCQNDSKKLKFNQNMTMVEEPKGDFRAIGKLSETYLKVGNLDLPQSIKLKKDEFSFGNDEKKQSEPSSFDFNKQSIS